MKTEITRIPVAPEALDAAGWIHAETAQVYTADPLGVPGLLPTLLVSATEESTLVAVVHEETFALLSPLLVLFAAEGYHDPAEVLAGLGFEDVTAK